MLVDFQYLKGKKKLLLSYTDDDGNIKIKYYDWEKPMKYVECDNDDPLKHHKYKSWKNKPVKLVETNNPDKYTIYEFIDSLPQEEIDLIFKYNTPKIFFIDIETEIVDGFPDPQKAETKILTISIVYDRNVIILGYKKISDVSIKRIETKTNEYFKKFSDNYKVKYANFEDEFTMLYYFFYKMLPKMPVITGWNFLNFDWLYLINRCLKLKKVINGREYKINPAVSSITKKMYKKFGINGLFPYHKMIFDYMQLYEIFDTSIKIKESSSLDFVSNKLVGIEKIKYLKSIYVFNKDVDYNNNIINKGSVCFKNNRGYIIKTDKNIYEINENDFKLIENHVDEINITNLQKLYDYDYEMFLYYNVVDTILVQKIHEIRNYISIVYNISCIAKIRVGDVISHVNNSIGSIAITSGVLRNNLRNIDNIVLFRDEYDVKKYNMDPDESKVSGGWVKDPVIGINSWVVCYDFASLYPSTILQFYISPETYIGNVNSITNIDHNDIVVCVNGIAYKKKKSATMSVLEKLYSDRKKYKKIMLQKKHEYDMIMDEIEQLSNKINNKID